MCRCFVSLADFPPCPISFCLLVAPVGAGVHVLCLILTKQLRGEEQVAYSPPPGQEPLPPNGPGSTAPNLNLAHCPPAPIWLLLVYTGQCYGKPFLSPH